MAKSWLLTAKPFAICHDTATLAPAKKGNTIAAANE